ncbi:MAG TPA: glycosyltransferase family 4 protein [Methylibium sp.]|uniref:MraY family glycosyltransferase n=1 Tax=Methylibium sp. TaxID=2067992 RepID=UPI002DB6DE3B|nr:glycosyltransferase family 4 protein [Methylibium sp.]HEU4460734.1 glycosyltransferase family 4 protein [Methylibium sp.]
MTALAGIAGQLAVVLAASWALTALMRRHAIATQLIDQPNARSSHVLPTPRGGGVAIVASYSTLIVGWWIAGFVEAKLAWALWGSSLPVALIGYLDDRRPVPARLRFAIHIGGAVFVLALMGGLPRVPMLGFHVDLGWFGLALATAYLVWMVNLVNFMDGIDGIASVEAITVSLGAALCWWIAAPQGPWFVPVGFAACVAGFLIWNWPPAKIFMGDAGSGFIGMALGTLSLWSSLDAPRLFWCWFILIGVFFVDATTTLVRRHRRGDKFHEAHRSHAYQYASRVHGGHRPVTLACAALNVFWLLPIALLVAKGWLDGVLGVAIAFAPLLKLAFHYKAGDRAAQQAAA